MRLSRPAASPQQDAICALVRESMLLEGEGPPSAIGGHPSENLLASYLDRVLAPAEEEAFERHVAFCPSCAEELVFARRSGIGRKVREPAHYLRIAATVALVLGGLVAALLAGQQVGARLEASLKSGLQAALGGKATIDELSFGLVDGPAVELGGLHVSDPTRAAESLLTAPSARFKVDLGALGRGKLQGSLKLDHPIVNVVCEPSGQLNIDAVLPKSGAPRDLMATARRKAIRSVEVISGTVRLIDRSGSRPHEVRMASVDAELSGLGESTLAHVEARAGLESTKQNVLVAGDVGPLDGSDTPRYRFSRVTLNSVSLRALPQIGSAIRGGLSYQGSLSSSGESWLQIRDRFSGQGEASVVSGAILGRNLVGDVLNPVVGGVEPSSRFGALLAARETGFVELRGHVSIADARLSSRDLVLNADQFALAGRGSLDSSGEVSFTGKLTMTTEAARELAAAAPGLRELMDHRGEVSIPFSLAGVWPNVTATVDVERLASEWLRGARGRLVRLRLFSGPVLPLLG